MLPTVIYLIEAIRRALKKSGRGVFMLIDVFGEAMDDWRKAKRKYPFADKRVDLGAQVLLRRRQ